MRAYNAQRVPAFLDMMKMMARLLPINYIGSSAIYVKCMAAALVFPPQSLPLNLSCTRDIRHRMQLLNLNATIEQLLQ